MASIKSVVTNFNGLHAGVTFKNGVTNTENPHLIEWFKSHGYTIEDEDAENTPDKPAEPKKRKSKAN